MQTERDQYMMMFKMETKFQQVVPYDVIGDWVFEKRRFISKVENVIEMAEVFSQYFA